MKNIGFSFHPKLVDCLGGYNASTLVADIGAGISVGILALPLAMAFAIASGVSPAQGLYTAFIVVVSGILGAYGFSGLCVATVMAGLILVVMGITKMGNAIRYIPRPVTIGFTNGIAILIMSTQVKDFFGLQVDKMPEDFIPKMRVIFETFSTLSIPTLILFKDGQVVDTLVGYHPKAALEDLIKKAL